MNRQSLKMSNVGRQKRNFAKQHEEPLQSRKLSVGICEIIYFGFNLKDKESTWWISF